MAVGVTYWNANAIDAIKLARERSEQTRKETLFAARHIKSLHEVYRSHEALYYPTSSLAIGLITVENQMRSLASATGLKELEWRHQVNSFNREQVLCQLSLQGELKQVLQFVSQAAAHAYLPVQRLNLQVAPHDLHTRAEMEVILHYRIVEGPQADESPLQALQQQGQLNGDSL